MPNTPLTTYAWRFERLFAYVDAHIDETLSVATLSDVAGLSRFHCQRQFSRLFGVSIHQYVQLVRLRRAAYQLAFRDHRILDVALDAQYESHEAFTRAFKKAIHQTPSHFRGEPDWETWFNATERLRAIRAGQSVALQVEDVHIRELPATRVAALEHHGDPRRLLDTVRRFIQWRRSEGVPPKSATFNIAYDDPEYVEPHDFRFDVCVAIDRPISGANDIEIVEKIIPATRCASFRHVGTDDALWRKVGEIYSMWLPASGEAAGDFPLFLQRVELFPEVPEHRAITDVFLPLT